MALNHSTGKNQFRRAMAPKTLFAPRALNLTALRAPSLLTNPPAAGCVKTRPLRRLAAAMNAACAYAAGCCQSAFVNSALLVLLPLCLCLGGCFFTSGGGSTDTMQPKGVSVPKGSRGTKPYTIRGKTYYPLLSSHGFQEQGIASWYGKDFHGKKTANGETYDMYGMTAAHKLLPFGTNVKVTNRENGKSIVVRINDRGPFVSNRVIDLTRTGAEKIGMIAKGTAPVILETTGSVPAIKDGDMQGRFYVQVGAFANKSNADGLVAKLQRKGGARTYFADQVGFWRVQAGPYSSLNKAEAAAEAMLNEYPNNFVVAE